MDSSGVCFSLHRLSGTLQSMLLLLCAALVWDGEMVVLWVHVWYRGISYLEHHSDSLIDLLDGSS